MKSDVIGFEANVLDHGLIKVIDVMGEDQDIVDAARLSYAGAENPQTRPSEGLIRYLMRNLHTSPFEMCEIKMAVKMPIFTARQWLRHRTANVNEWSGRYSIMLPEWYQPQKFRGKDAINHQGSSGELDSDDMYFLSSASEMNQKEAFDLYNDMVNNGVSNEMARMHLPLSTYTTFIWKIDLHNLFHFLSLRADDHAQYEIRVYAEAIEQAVGFWVPMAFGAYLDYRKNARNLSALDMRGLRAVLSNSPVSREHLGMGKSEWLDFVAFVEELGLNVEIPGDSQD